jgi:hypothetical protein
MPGQGGQAYAHGNSTQINSYNHINIDGKSSVDELRNGLDFLKREIEDLKINNEKLTQYLNSMNNNLDTSKKKNDCNYIYFNFYLLFF